MNLPNKMIATIAGAACLCLAAHAAQAAPFKVLPDSTAMSASMMAQIERTARPMQRKLNRLPREVGQTLRATVASPGLPAVTRGSAGPIDGRSLRGNEPVASDPSASTGGIGPRNYGQGNQNTVYHYSDMLVDSELMNDTPYRQEGKFNFQAANGLWYHCSATLISRSILVTAGHCVHDGGNRNAGWIRQGYFTPGINGTNKPYGRAFARAMITTAGWFNQGQIDSGYDVGLVVLNKREGTSREIGSDTGWHSFCTSNCLQPYWQLTQLGYPGNYYSGNMMTEGQHLEVSNGRDYLYGSGMQGGSSGGGHIANMGALSDSSPNVGQWPYRNVVFAVTSWGYVDDVWKLQGASSLSGPGNGNNFPNLFNTACNLAKAAHGSGSCANV